MWLWRTTVILSAALSGIGVGRRSHMRRSSLMVISVDTGAPPSRPSTIQITAG